MARPSVRIVLVTLILLAACSSQGLSCEEYGEAITPIIAAMTVESSAAEALIRQGAERDFDEAASAELAVEFEAMAAASDRLAEFDSLDPPPDNWTEASQALREAVALQEEGVEELGVAFAGRDTEALGKAAMKMARTVELLSEIDTLSPNC